MSAIRKIMIGALATLSALSVCAGVYVKFDAQGGTFAISGMTMETGAIPDEVVTQRGYNDPMRMGYNFAGWSSIASPQSDEELDRGFEVYYATPVAKATTFYAIWERSEPNLCDYNGEWKCEDYGISGVITNDNGETACSCPVPGRGYVSFRYRLVSKDGSNVEIGSWCSIWLEDSYRGYYDGTCGIEVHPISYPGYAKGWQEVVLPVRSGDAIECCWMIQDWGEFGGDIQNVKMEVADIKWTPVEDCDVIIRLEPCGGTLPDGDIIVRRGQYGELPVPTREGCEFLGWNEGIYSGLDFPYPLSDASWLPFASNVTICAVWRVPPEMVADPDGTLGDEVRGNSFVLNESVEWGVMPIWGWDDCGEPVYAGENLGWSAELGPDEAIDLFSAEVHGCGTFRISSLDGSYSNAEIKFYIDEDEKILPGGDFEIRCQRCDEYEDRDLHTIRIAARRKPSKSDYDYFDEYWASGSLGSMYWVEAPSEITVTFDAHDGEISSSPVRTYSVGSTYGEFPEAERDGFEFCGWFADAECTDKVEQDEFVRLSVTNLHAKWTTDLKTAIGGGRLRYATKGEYRWGGTADYSHSTNYAAAGVCDIWWDKTNVMTTVVQGQGLLSFWWMKGGWKKGEVQPYGRPYYSYDNEYGSSLSLWLDGVKVRSFNGKSKWRHITLPVLGKGNHTVEWKYTPGCYPYFMGINYPNSYYYYYSPLEVWHFVCEHCRWDGMPRPCRPGAWVDDVAWKPVEDVDDVVEWTKGIVEGNGWLTNALPFIEAKYTARMSDDPSNLRWPISRALTKLLQLGENENLKAVLAQFGFAPNYQTLGRLFGELDYYDAPLSNEVVDSVADEAIPVLESALADLEIVPASWSETITLDPSVYPVDVPTSVDLADVTFCKVAVKGALAAIAVAEGYDGSVDYMNGEMESILGEAGLRLTFEDFVSDHPDFLKRARNLERLGEGKELLRETLTLFQVFDALMLSRTGEDVHLFEYDERDADKQLNVREDVAKMLAALDGETTICDSDFRYLKGYRIKGMEQAATLVPFFDGVLTRRFLPAQINGDVPVFDSFPGMSFGGTFPGLTKAHAAGWLAECGYEVEYTPGSDYDPPVTFRSFNTAIPRLGKDATDEEISSAMAGTADKAAVENVKDVESYDAYSQWAARLATSGVPLRAIKSSPYSWMSYALGASALLDRNLTAEDVKIESFEPVEGGGFVFEVRIADIGIGEGVEFSPENLERVKENLRQVLGVEGSDSLSVDSFSPSNVDIAFDSPVDGKARFKAVPKSSSGKFFMRVKVK